MSGAGKSSAADVLEDNGYHVIDNLPPELLSQVADFHGLGERSVRLAVVVDSRGGDAVERLQEVVQQLEQQGVKTVVLFLDADDNGSAVLASVEARPDLPPPSYVLHTSPNHVHLFWRVAGFDRDLVERLQKQLACELGLTAVDHCTHLDDADVAALVDSGTIATLLPGVEFSTRSPYPDARALLDAGATVALASDCNPGSSYTSSMLLCIALAVREMRMTPAEALWSATAGGARALDRDDVGVIGPGKRAHLTVLDAPSYLHLAYRPGVPLVREVFD